MLALILRRQRNQTEGNKLHICTSPAGPSATAGITILTKQRLAGQGHRDQEGFGAQEKEFFFF